MILPTIHLNGTSQAELETQVRNVVDALATAEEALQAMAPHQRDYYPQGESAWQAARNDHQVRLHTIHGMRAELEHALLAIYDQRKDR